MGPHCNLRVAADHQSHVVLEGAYQKSREADTRQSRDRHGHLEGETAPKVWDWSNGYSLTEENWPKDQKAGILQRWTGCGFQRVQKVALVAEMTRHCDKICLLEASYCWNDNPSRVLNREEGSLVFGVEIGLVT